MIHEDAYVRYFGDQDEHREYRVARVHENHVDLDDGYHGHIQATSDEYEVVEDIRAMYKQEKERADRLQVQLESLSEFIPSLRSAVQSTLYYSNPYVEESLQADIGAYSSLMEQILKELEDYQ